MNWARNVHDNKNTAEVHQCLDSDGVTLVASNAFIFACHFLEPPQFTVTVLQRLGYPVKVFLPRGSFICINFDISAMRNGMCIACLVFVSYVYCMFSISFVCVLHV